MSNSRRSTTDTDAATPLREVRRSWLRTMAGTAVVTATVVAASTSTFGPGRWALATAAFAVHGAVMARGLRVLRALAVGTGPGGSVRVDRVVVRRLAGRAGASSALLCVVAAALVVLPALGAFLP